MAAANPPMPSGSPRPVGRPAVPRPRVRQVLMTADAVGGIWRYALDLAAALANREVRVTLAVMGPAPDAAAAREAAARGIAVRHRPYRLEWMDDPWEDVRRAGAWLLELERTIAPDLVHLNGFAHAALSWRAPVLVVAHSCVCTWWRAVKGEPAPDRFRAYRSAVADGLRAASLVVAPTRAMLDGLRREYDLSGHGCVVPNGTDISGFAPAADRKEPIVLAAGRVWDAAKNLTALSAAAGRLPWPVVVAGDDHEPGGTGLTLGGVRGLGRLSSGQLRTWYARAGIFAHPARYEPFGLAVLEAAAAGCALVLGDIASLRENWDGAAEFVPPDDPGALGAVLGRLIACPDRRRERSRAAAARAARFGIDRTAEEYVRLYEDLGAPRARSRAAERGAVAPMRDGPGSVAESR
jgi:glycogen synthase